jgi:hypothetical protein
MSFRKGSPRHVLAGKIFVASMLTMAVGAVLPSQDISQTISAAVFQPSI